MGQAILNCMANKVTTTEWFQELEKALTDDDPEEFVRRVAGWRGRCDEVVLAFRLLQEITAIRDLLENKSKKMEQE